MFFFSGSCGWICGLGKGDWGAGVIVRIRFVFWKGLVYCRKEIKVRGEVGRLCGRFL